MKKRLFSLALALALCLWLAVPAMAADTSGLDADGAQAYYTVLHDYSLYEQVVIHADLRDMDGDKIPELIVITTSIPDELGNNSDIAWIDIWQLDEKSHGEYGIAHKRTRVECAAGIEGSLEYVSRDGKLYIRASNWVGHWAVVNSDIQFISIGGVAEKLTQFVDQNEGYEREEYTQEVNGSITNITEKQFNQYDSAYTKVGSCFASGSAYSWCREYGASHAPSYQELLKQLAAKANEVPATPTPAPGTFGPYTIQGIARGNPFTITFNTAKVESKTIQIRDHYTTGVNTYSSYQKANATIVTLKPDVEISVFGGDIDLSGVVGVSTTPDGNDRYTREVVGAVDMIQSGVGLSAFCLNAGDAFDLQTETGRYIIMINFASSTPTTPSFTDVPAGEYYAAPVSWAVSKNITNGTSATAFSPDQTCTQVQILTFLYRAVRNGGTADASDMDKAINWARGKGMIDGGFDSGKPCTRASAVKFIWQAMGSPRPSTTSSFRDVSATASYASAVSWAVGAGVTNGTSSTTFSPNDTCTRGQIVTFLHRAMG